MGVGTVRVPGVRRGFWVFKGWVRIVGPSLWGFAWTWNGFWIVCIYGRWRRFVPCLVAPVSFLIVSFLAYFQFLTPRSMSLPSGTPASSLLQKTVLIIDDDPLFQEELTGALAGAGYRVENAYDGEAGLQSIIKEAPDLVILDLILPKKDGFKVLREMKSQEAMKKIPVIVLSNLQNSDNIEVAVGLGVTDYLVKSNYTTAQIVQKIRSVLGEN